MNGAESATEAGPSTKTQAEESAKGFGEEDFIAFAVSEAEDEDRDFNKESVEQAKAIAREYEKGKGKEREYESAGRKRKADEIDYNDGYTNKKERLDANSRRAPWVAGVNWEKCNNVAEMCVQPC